MTKSYYSMAREGVMGLATENDTLLRTNARQAKTIRTLTERNSQLEAEVIQLQYQLELVKLQGRKARKKLRAYRDEQKNYVKIADALDRANAQGKEREELVGKLQQETVRVALENASNKAAVHRLMDGRPLALEVVTEQFPFRTKRVPHYEKLSGFMRGDVDPRETKVAYSDMATLEVRQCAIQLRVAPEHGGDLLMHAEVAKQAAERLCRGVEQQILDALRGEPIAPGTVEKARYDAKVKASQNPEWFSASAQQKQGDIYPRRFRDYGSDF